MKKHIILFAFFFLSSGLLFASYRPTFRYTSMLTETKAYGKVFSCPTIAVEGSPLSFSLGSWCFALEGSGDTVLPSAIQNCKRIPNRFKVALGPSVSYRIRERLTVRGAFLGGAEFFPLLMGMEVFWRAECTPEIKLLPWLYATMDLSLDYARDHQDYSFGLGLKIVGGER